MFIIHSRLVISCQLQHNFNPESQEASKLKLQSVTTMCLTENASKFSHICKFHKIDIVAVWSASKGFTAVHTPSNYTEKLFNVVFVERRFIWRNRIHRKRLDVLILTLAILL